MQLTDQRQAMGIHHCDSLAPRQWCRAKAKRGQTPFICGLASRAPLGQGARPMTLDTGPRLVMTGGERPSAVVVAVQLPDVTDLELDSSLSELERLAKTLGLDPIGRLTQRRGALASGVVLGEGKLKELASWTGGKGVVPTYEKPGRRRREDDDEQPEVGSETGHAEDAEVAEVAEAATNEAPSAPEAKAKVVLIDHDLTPTQQRN